MATSGYPDDHEVGCGTAMIALLQRVVEASVRIETRTTASIGRGLLVLVGVRPSDNEDSALRLLDRILKYRVFGDAAGRLNLNLQQIKGDLLLVPQFTLAADTRHGLRPGFSTAAPPDQARHLFDVLLVAARSQQPTASGEFGADMQVSLTNDGPVTVWIES